MTAATNLDDLYQVTPRQAKEYVTDCLFAGLVPFLQSSPGLGKSSIMRAIAQELNLKLIDHRLSTSPPEDLSGLPRFDQNGYAYFAPFAELFPLANAELPVKTKAVHDADGNVVKEATYYDGWLLFLDEFNSAKKDTQAAAYKLILDHMVGQHYLHERCLIAAAGNLSTDRAIVNPLSTAMQSRVIHIHMKVDFDDWLRDVALKENYDHRLIGYLSQHPSKLMDFRPDHQERTFNCPRTWEFMNKFVKGKPVTKDKAPLYAGTITSGSAADFVAFCQVFGEIPKIGEIMADPKGTRLPRDLNSKWAVTSSLLEHVNEDTLDKLAEYVNRFEMTFRILFFRSVMVRAQDLRQHPAFTKAMLDLAKYLRD